MDPNIENDMNGTDVNDSQPSTTAKPSSFTRASGSSINTTGATDIRKSVRLSTKTPNQKAASGSQSKIHRTIGGGVAGNNSPKLNIRRRTSGSTDVQTSSASSLTSLMMTKCYWITTSIADNHQSEY